jgi:NADH-quinone oxidoreductase subunit M
MGSAGLPSLSGFVGEFLTILGTFIAGDTLPQGYGFPMPRLLGALAATGVVLGAIYLLWMFQKVFFGKLDKAKNGKLKDLDARELCTFIPLVIGIFLLGMFPRPLLVVMEPSVQKFMRDFGRRVAECDGPTHTFGTINCDANGKPQATIPKNLDEAAKGGARGPRGIGGAGGGSAGSAGGGSAGSAGGGSAGSAGGGPAGGAGSALPERPTP